MGEQSQPGRVGCSPGLTEERAPAPQGQGGRAQDPILSPGQEGRCLLRADGSGQWLPVACEVGGVRVPSRRRLAMHGPGSASVTGFHGPQRPRLLAGHPPLGNCPQNPLLQEDLWGSSKSIHRCPPAATQAWAGAAHPLSEQSHQSPLLAWSCWAGGPAFSCPSLSPGDFALGRRQLGQFPPDVRLSAVWDVSLEAVLLAVTGQPSPPLLGTRCSLGLLLGSWGLGPGPAWAELAPLRQCSGCLHWTHPPGA